MINAIRALPAAKLVNAGRHDSTPLLPEGIPLEVEIKVDPSEAIVEIDLRDNVDNVNCGYNQSEATATSSVLAGLFNSLNSDIPQNAGSFRRIRVHLRERAVAGIPKFPHSCSVATTNVSDRMVNLTGAAFASLAMGRDSPKGRWPRRRHGRGVRKRSSLRRRALCQPVASLHQRGTGFADRRRMGDIRHPWSRDYSIGIPSRSTN